MLNIEKEYKQSISSDAGTGVSLATAQILQIGFKCSGMPVAFTQRYHLQ